MGKDDKEKNVSICHICDAEGVAIGQECPLCGIVNAGDEPPAAEEVSDGTLRDMARDKYACDDLEIDDDAKTSRGDDGAWVAAWVWVSYPEWNPVKDEEDAA